MHSLMISLVASCCMCLTFSCSVAPSIEVQRSPLPWGDGISWPVIPPHLCWLLHLYTDSVPLSQPALPCNESRAQRSFDLIYCLPVLFSASSKQPFETCPQNKAATAVSHWLMRLTHIARERVRTFLAQYGVSFLCLSDFSWVCF